MQQTSSHIKHDKPIPITKNDIKEMVCEVMTRLNENLKTHNDSTYNLYDKLDEYGIFYDFVNDSESIIEIETPNDSIKSRVKQLLNYYGWKNIRETDSSIFAEMIYGELYNDFYDDEAEEDFEDGDEYPHGVGIYYHITKSENVKSILKKGLITRDGIKRGYERGQRTYLLSFPSKELAYELFDKQKTNVTILLVDLRKYLGNQINIYRDEFTDGGCAVYTYDYIPPDCISVYETFDIYNT